MKEELIQEIGKTLGLIGFTIIVTSTAYATYRIQKWAFDHPSTKE